MRAVRTLDAGLRGVTGDLGFSERLAHGAQVRLDGARPLRSHCKLRAQRLQALLTLDDAGVRIGAARHPQPVAPDPFTARAS